VDIDNGPCPHNRAEHFLHFRNDIQRRRRAQSDLQYAKPAGDQRFGDRARMGDVFDDEHRNDRCGAHDGFDCVHCACSCA
jgi:hypothetical protein